MGHLERLAAIEQRLATVPGLFLAGSGFRAIGIPDCIADGREMAARAAAFVASEAPTHTSRRRASRSREGTSTMKPVHLIGVPLDLGAGRRGVDMGPPSLRIAGVATRIAALGRTVVDKGDLPTPIPETQQPADAAKKYVREIARVCQQLHDDVRRSLDAAALPVVLGGDHSLAAGSVAASADWVRTRPPVRSASSGWMRTAT